MKILIVEDEGLIANNLSDNLRKNGYEISGISASGEDAVEKANSLKPDLVLMDIHLDGQMTGIDAAEKLRTTFPVPVIFLTAHANRDILDRAKQTCPFGYLVKPVRQVDLINAIEVATYKHEMEQKLKRREAWLATTLRCAGDAVIITDTNGRIEFLNDLSRQILGLGHGEIEGQIFGEAIRLKSRFSGASAGDLVQMAILQGATINIGSDVMLVDSLQREIDVEGEMGCCEMEGVAVGAVFTFRDSTLRNHKEQGRWHDFGSEACARLAGAVSVELNKLLQPDANIWSANNPPAANPWREQSLSEMIGQLETLRQRDGAFPETLDLNQLLTGVCAELRPGVPPGIELSWQPESGLPSIYADPAQIKQAIGNLILYALNCIREPATIRVTTQNCALQALGRNGQEDSYVRLAMQIAGNTGAMSADDTAGLFETFPAGDPASARLDLRLFLVHRNISNAQGFIRAQARAGEGLLFEILLPRCGARLAREPESAELASAVLLVHSDPGMRALIADGLERQGYPTLAAANSEEAREWSRFHPQDIGVCITDAEFGRELGIDLAQELAASHPGIRIIFVNGPEGSGPEGRPPQRTSGPRKVRAFSPNTSGWRSFSQRSEKC